MAAILAGHAQAIPRINNDIHDENRRKAWYQELTIALSSYRSGDGRASCSFTNLKERATKHIQS
jgi:hypothetical protein